MERAVGQATPGDAADVTCMGDCPWVAEAITCCEQGASQSVKDPSR